jgi:hypothetical protein
MIYNNIEKGLRASFAFIENAKNAIKIRKDLEKAKEEFKTAYQEIFQLMGILKKSKNRSPDLDITYNELLVLHDKTLFDAIKNIHNLPESKLEAICQIIENILTKEIVRIEKLKEKKAAA